ncbi:hypothetical protein MKX08_000570 [Trichoderma sp. CBMAI-0020]|nr:hypothetical protein MKX08_000570 [Trichoderma sp. CBMAI-0020]
MMDSSLPDGLPCPPRSPAPSDAGGLEEIDSEDAMLDLIVWPEPDEELYEFDEETGPQGSRDIEEVNRVAEIPPPPPSAVYDSFDDLMAFLQGFHRENGAAVRKLKSASPREINGVKTPTYVILVCDQAGSIASTSTGIRKSSTQRTECPFKITATATKRSN